MLDPGHPDTLWIMVQVSSLLIDLGLGAEALPVLDECLRLADGQAVNPRLLLPLFEQRLRYSAGAKDAAACRATAARSDRLRLADADCLYNAACL